MLLRRFAFAFVLAALVASVAAADEKPTPVTGNGVTTKSGLQYWDIKAGSGAEAASGDIVRVNYTGWLTNGTMFDTNRAHGNEPLRFWLGKGNVIKGWDEGVAGMKLGGKRQLHIPARLGYGEKGTGNIPPNSDLVFDVELVGVSK